MSMARVEENLIVRSLRGKIGDIVVKQYRHGSVITKVPDMSKVKPSASQKQRRIRFSKAVAYAKAILSDSRTKSTYQRRLKRGSSVYHAAISEYLKKNH